MNDTRARILADRQLQSERIAFERDKAAYEQNAQHLRSLNQFLWQVPTLAITLTGGLWYAVTKIDAWIVREGLLLFAAISDLVLVVVLLRVRHLFHEYLIAQRGFNPRFEIKNERGPAIGSWKLPSKTVVYCFIGLLILGAGGSLFGVWNLFKAAEMLPHSIKSCLDV